MLILTRRVGESLKVIQPDGTVVTATVLGVKGNQVRLGIEAPKEVLVHREEIYERIQGQPKQAGGCAPVSKFVIFGVEGVAYG